MAGRRSKKSSAVFGRPEKKGLPNKKRSNTKDRVARTQKTNVERKKICKYQKIFIGESAAFFFIVLIFLIICYVGNKQKIEELFHYWSDFVKVILAVCGGELVVTLVLHFKDKKIEVWISMCIAALIILFTFIGGSSFEILAYISGQKFSNTSGTTENTINKKGNAAAEGDETVVIVKVPYIMESDYFLDKLESYCGVASGTIAESEEIEKKEEIILTLLEDNRKEKCKVSDGNYTAKMEAADKQHSNYKEQLDNISKNEEVEELLGPERIKDLQTAKEWRVEVDDVRHLSENQIQISLYCIEEGDECIWAGDRGTAESLYLEAAKWAMQSIAQAVREDMDEETVVLHMERGWFKLKDSEKSLIAMEEKTEGNLKKVSSCCEAYRRAIEKWVTMNYSREIDLNELYEMSKAGSHDK